MKPPPTLPAGLRVVRRRATKVFEADYAVVSGLNPFAFGVGTTPDEAIADARTLRPDLFEQTEPRL